MSAIIVALGVLCKAGSCCGSQTSQLGRTVCGFSPWQLVWHLLVPWKQGRRLSFQIQLKYSASQVWVHSVFSTKDLPSTSGRQPKVTVFLLFFLRPSLMYSRLVLNLPCMHLKMTLNSWSFCFCLPSPGITGIHHHTSCFYILLKNWFI